MSASLGQLLRGGGIYVADAVVDSARELHQRGKAANGAQGARRAGAGVTSGSGGGGTRSAGALCATPRLQRGLESMVVQLVCFGKHDARAVQAAAEVMASLV